ncbi:MAG: hypothetical protein IJC88_06555 [Oscillospiraceae bacterium]|nr:hypothetical protein [Oscillospiraceae bacterium]
MKKRQLRICSFFLAVCMLVCLLPTAGAIDSSLNDGKAIYRYNQHLLAIKSAGSSSIVQDLRDFDTIWSTAMGHAEYKPYIIDGNGGAGALWVGPYETDETKDSYSAKAEDLATDPYAIIGTNTTVVAGAGYGVAAVAGSGRTWYSMKILVPTAGTYTFESQFYSIADHATSVQVYLAKAEDYNAQNPIDADNLIGTYARTNRIPSGAGSAYNALFTLPSAVALDAGEYVVTYCGDAERPVYGGTLTLYGNAAASPISLNAETEADVLDLAVGESCEVAIAATDANGDAIDLSAANITEMRVDKTSDFMNATYADGKLRITANRGGYGTATLYLVLDGSAAAWVDVSVRCREENTGYYRYNQHNLVTYYNVLNASQTKYLSLADLGNIWKMTKGHSTYAPHWDGAEYPWVGPYETESDGNNMSAVAADIASEPYAILGTNSAIGFLPGQPISVTGKAGGAWYSMKISVPTAGAFDVESYFYGASSLASAIDCYIIKASEYKATQPIQPTGYVGRFKKTNMVPSGAASAYKGLFRLDRPVNLEAGEYVVTYHAVDAKPFYGGSMTLYQYSAGNKVTLKVDASKLNASGALELVPGASAVLDVTAVDANGETVDLSTASLSDVRVDYSASGAVGTYQNGKITVRTSAGSAAVGSKTSLTLYMVIDKETSAWVEIPITFVAASGKTLTMGHIGATTELPTGFGCSVELTAAVDGVDVAIDEYDVIDVAALDANRQPTSAITVSVKDGIVSAKTNTSGDYIVLVTATIDGILTSYEMLFRFTPLTHYYDYMKMASFSTHSVGWQIEQFIDDYADTWTGGSTSITATPSAPWKPDMRENCGPWLMTTSAKSIGAYFLETAPGGWTRVKFYLPVSGNYTVTTVFTKWASGGLMDYYLAPADVADPMSEDYLMNSSPISHNGTGEASERLAIRQFEAGEYVITYKSVGDTVSGGFFIKGLRFTLNSNPGTSRAYIDLDAGVKVLGVDETATVNAQVLPGYLAQEISWSSEDESIATVKDGVITGKANGITSVTATLPDGARRSIEVVVGAPTYEYKIWDCSNAEYLAANRNNVSMHLTKYYNQGYNAAYASGLATDPWFFKASDTGAGAPYLYFNWNASIKNLGLLAAYGSEDTGYTRIQLRISEDGVYRLLSAQDMSAQYGAISPSVIHLAPIGAANPTADEFLVERIEGTRAPLGGKSNTPILSDEISLKAGEYYLTVTKLPSTRRVFMADGSKGLDFLSHYNYSLYKTENLTDVSVSTINGAQMRNTGAQGLRFISSIDKNAVDWDRVVEFGTVLIPTADLNTKRDLVIGAKYNGHSVAKVPAVNYYAETDDTITFTAVLTNIADTALSRSITVRAYAILDDGSVVYGDTFASRSIYEIATRIVADPNASETDRAAAEVIVAKVEGSAQ